MKLRRVPTPRLERYFETESTGDNGSILGIMTDQSLPDANVLSGLCEIISDPAVVIDAEGVFVDVIHNAHNGALFYRDPETLLGTDLWDVFSTPQADRFYTVIEDALQTGETQRMEYQLSLDGVDRHFEARATPVGGDAGRVVWLAEDITQRKQRQRKQALIERVFEISPVGHVVVEPSGDISTANARAEELLGLEREEITRRRYNQPDWEIYYEDGTPIPESEHPVTRVFESGEPVFGFEHWIELADGTERWLSSNAAPILGDDGDVERVVVGLEDAERCFGTVSQFLPCHRQPEAPKSVRWAVLTAGSRLPGTYDCLERALTGSTLLEASDFPHCLRFGVDTQSDTFEAHAWVESNGDVLIGDVDDFGRFRALTEREVRG